MFSVVKTLYCQRIPLWRTQAIRKGAVLSLEHKRRMDAKGNYNSIEIEGKTLCLQQDHKYIPNRCIGTSFTKFSEVVSGLGNASVQMPRSGCSSPLRQEILSCFWKTWPFGSVSNETKKICPTLKTLDVTDINGGILPCSRAHSFRSVPKMLHMLICLSFQAWSCNNL